MLTYEAINWLANSYFGVVLYLTIVNLIHANNKAAPQYDRRRLNRSLVNLILIFMIITSVMFVYLQTDWVLNDHNLKIGGLTDMMWLVWQYLIGTVFLLVNTLLTYLIKWKRRDFFE